MTPVVRVTNLIPRRLPVFPALALSDVNALAVVHLYLDRLISAVTTKIVADIVAFLLQLANCFPGNATLHVHVSAGLGKFFAGRFAVTFMLPARGVASFLHAHSEIDLVRQDLDMPL